MAAHTWAKLFWGVLVSSSFKHRGALHFLRLGICFLLITTAGWLHECRTYKAPNITVTLKIERTPVPPLFLLSLLLSFLTDPKASGLKPVIWCCVFYPISIFEYVRILSQLKQPQSCLLRACIDKPVGGAWVSTVRGLKFWFHVHDCQSASGNPGLGEEKQPSMPAH